MALQFSPERGTILICDFQTGFRPPEMVKVRPVITVSPRRRGSRLVTVVPLSSTEPSPLMPWHYELPTTVYPPAHGRIWAKCDMIVTVSIDRLDRVKTKDRSGKRVYQSFAAPQKVMDAIEACIRSALGFA